MVVVVVAGVVAAAEGVSTSGLGCAKTRELALLRCDGGMDSLYDC